MRIALKVDVDTYRGTLEGVPALLRLFDQHQITTTFLFSVGPDHTGRALRRIFRPGFLSKVRRTSVAAHYGWRTLMYGVLLPGPHIGRRAGHIMRETAEAGHEVGIHCYDHVRWQDSVVGKNADWTRRELQFATDAFEEALGYKATVIGAPGWQINPHTLALEEEFGFSYASDVRGESIFYPVMDGVTSHCPQIPTTLPTLDELVGCAGIDESNAHDAVFEASRRPLPHGHVYTLHAELEGMKLLGTMEHLLSMWREAGDDVGSLQSTFDAVDKTSLTTKTVIWGDVPGRSGKLAVEGGPPTI